MKTAQTVRWEGPSSSEVHMAILDLALVIGGSVAVLAVLERIPVNTRKKQGPSF